MAFLIFVRSRKQRRFPVSFGKFQNAVVWGVKGKILCPVGCQNPVAQITKAKEILKNPRPAGSWRPLKCIFSGKEKRPPTAGRKSCSVRSMYGKTRQGQSAAVLEQVSTTVPKSAILRFCPSRETCWGVPSPNPAMAACTAKIFPSGRPLFCENRPGNT